MADIILGISPGPPVDTGHAGLGADARDEVQLFAHRAPDNRFLLRVFVGGDGKEACAELPDDVLISMVREQLDLIAGIRAEPCVSRIYRWPKGNPQYDVGHLQRVDEMERMAARFPGLHFTGSAFRGIGIPDCVQSAVKTVDRIFEQNP